MAKRGRKTLFRDYMLTEGYRLGALGLTLEEIADFWNIHRATLHRWTKKHPEFCDAIKRGKDEADVTVIQALLKEAKEGNIAGIIFWLKNRQPDKWRDRQQVEHLGIKSAEMKIFNFINTKSEKEINELITGDSRKIKI